jgi:hypothetical protein
MAGRQCALLEYLNPHRELKSLEGLPIRNAGDSKYITGDSAEAERLFRGKPNGMIPNTFGG